MILNFKRNRSAGTAAKKRSKCSLFARMPLLLAILMLSAVFCRAQTDSSGIGLKFTTSIYGNSGLLASQKDSTWYEKHLDTIKTDFVIIVDSNNFVKKVRCDFIVHKFEQERHSGIWINSLLNNRNDTFLLNNKPIEVLLYRPKDERWLLVGNSR